MKSQREFKQNFLHVLQQQQQKCIQIRFFFRRQPISKWTKQQQKQINVNQLFCDVHRLVDDTLQQQQKTKTKQKILLIMSRN